MANLTNINGYFNVTNSGLVNVVNGGLYVTKTSGDSIVGISSSGGSGKPYYLKSNTSGSFLIYDDTACDARLTISSGGDATFTGRVDAPTMSIADTDSLDSSVKLRVAGNLQLGSDNSGGAITKIYESSGLNLDSGSALRNIYFRINGTEKLKIDTSGNATFAGNITSTGTVITLDSAGSAGYIADRANDTSGATYEYKTGGSLKWYTGLRGVSTEDFYLFNNAQGSTALLINSSNNNATFAGQVHIDSKPNSGLAYNVLIDVGSAGDGTIGYQTVAQLAANLSVSSSSNWVKSSNDIYNTNSGNVGINETSPRTKLEIKVDTSSRNTVTRALTLNANGAGLQPYEPFGTGIIFEGFDYAGGGGTSTSRDYAYIDARIETSGSTPVDFTSRLVFATNSGGTSTTTPTTKMVITGQGDVGIGVTSPDAKLDVQSSGSWGAYGRGSGGDINVENTNTSVNEGGWISIAGYTGNTANGGFYHMAGITAKKSTASGDGDYGGDLSFWTTAGAGQSPEANSGMYQRMTINRVGNVGIGTTTPDRKLTVQSGSYSFPSGIDNNSFFTIAQNSWSGMTLLASTTTGSFIDFGDTDAGWRGRILYAHNGDYMYFSTAATERMRIDSSGGVGIGAGTIPADHRLQIHNPSFTYSRFALTNSATGSASGDGLKFQIENLNAIIKNQENGYLTFGTNGRETDLHIDSSGNVGIGNTSPTAKLTIDNSISTSYSTTGYAATPANSMLYLNNTNGGSNTASLINFRTGSGDGVLGFVEGGGTNDADFVIQTDGGSNGIERFRITNAGNVGIGTTSPVCGLDVRIISGAQFYNESATESNSNIRCRHEGAETTSDRATQISFRDDDDNEVGSIKSSGSSTFYNTSSDYRLKQNEKDFNGLDLVDNIKVYDFEWKKDGGKDYGVFAHELQEIVPEAVSGEKDGEEMQGVDYSRLVPILLKSIQELKTEIQILKTKI